MNHDYVEQD